MKCLIKIIPISALIIIIQYMFLFCSNYPDTAYWPKENWRTSTPEEQGIDPEKIYQMLKFLKATENMHSILIIRNGYLVTETYFSPYRKNIRESIISPVNSIISALVGIAIQKGYIKDANQKVLNFFPEYSFSNVTEMKKAMTIVNLLSMTSGLDWPWRQDPVLTGIMMKSEDPVRYVLDFPMALEPGTRFSYCGGTGHILSAIICRTSGKSTLDFADEYLFKPLGIHGAVWPADTSGINWGGFGLCLSPLELARFGYLYLRHGVWEGKQLVPAEWIEESTKKQVNWDFFTEDNIEYGYNWWIEPFGYSARGWSGNYLFVIPGLDMVIVFTGESRYFTLHQSPPQVTSFRGEFRDTAPNRFFSQLVSMYIIPSVKSVKPLPPDEKTDRDIKNLIKETENPKVIPVFPLPAEAYKISGKTIECGSNEMHINSCIMHFEQTNTCFITISYAGGGVYTFAAGLDGVYRASKIPGPVETAYKGAWIDDFTFIIDEQELWESERLFLSFTFAGNTVSIDVSGSVSGHYETIKGVLKD